MGLDGELRDALQGKATRLGRSQRLAMAYERGDWPAVAVQAHGLRLSAHAIPALYQQAVAWAREQLPQRS
jgi:hypothetical protein